MSGGGSQTTTSSTTVPPQFLAAYQNTVNRAQGVANTPYQAYTGNLVAGFSGDQTQAQQEVEQQQGGYQDDLNAAAGDIQSSTAPLWSGVMQSGANPSAGTAGYNPNYWGGVAQSGANPSAGIAGYNPNTWGSTMQSGVAPSAGVAGYTKNFYGNAPGVNAQTIAQYEDPYQSQVIGATEGQIANTDAQQFNQLSGNAASSGAFGGDRMGVAQGILGGQQAVANNSTLAGLNQSNYSQALGEANQQQSTAIGADEAATQIGNAEFNAQQAAQIGANEFSTNTANSEFNQQQAAQLGANEASTGTANSEFNTQQQAQLGANEANAWLNSQAGYGMGSLASEGTNLGLTDASALAQSGLTQQQQQQAGLNTAYEQWQAQQAFPYQQTGWLANITEGIGSNVGGNSTTTQSSNAAGGRIGRDAGGIVPGGRRHYDGGGIIGDVPDVANSYIPTAGGSVGGGIGKGAPPYAQIAPQQPGMFSNPVSDVGAASGAVSLYKNLGGNSLVNSLGLGSLFGPSTAVQAGGFGASGVPAGWGAEAASAPVQSWAGGFGGGSAALTNGVAADSAAAGGASDTLAGASDAIAGLGTDAAASATSAASATDAAAGTGLLSTIGDGLASIGDWLLPLLALRDGGAVQPQHHASGGIIGAPYPRRDRSGIMSAPRQDRLHRASGGITGSNGNFGEAPYQMAPPVPLQATGTMGVPPIQIANPGMGGANPYMGGGASGMAGFSRGGAPRLGTGGVLPFPRLAMGGGVGGFLRQSGMMPSAMGAGVPSASAALAGNDQWSTPHPFGMEQGGQQWRPPVAPATGAANGVMGATGGATTGGPMPFKTGGGIVVPFRQHFDVGGATDDDAFGGAGAADTGSWDAGIMAGAPSSASTPTSGIMAAVPNTPSSVAGSSSDTPSGIYAPQKPSLILPTLAAVATGILGRHTNQGRNIAEGVLAGLGTYGKEDAQYQEGSQKAASLQQEAKRLADDAAFHRDQIANEQQRTDNEGKYQTGMLANDQARTASQNAYQTGELGLRGQEVANTGAYQAGELGIRGQEAATQAAAEKSMEAWRTAQGNATTPIGTNPADGSIISASKYGNGLTDANGNPYTGPVGPMPGVQARVNATTRGQDLSHGDRVSALDQAWTLKSAGLNAQQADSVRKQADAFYMGAAASGKPITPEAAVDAALAQHSRTSNLPPVLPAQPPGQQAAGAAPAPATVAPQGSGWLQNPATGQWKSPTGQIFDASGKPIP